MSWDVMVMDFGGDPPSMDELDAADSARAMGTPHDVRLKIDAHLDGVDWSDPTWGIYRGDGFTFEFNMGDEDPKEGFMVHVRGGGDAVTTLLQFAAPNAWSLLDCSTGDFIDPDNPSREGWEGFQAFRDKALDRSDGDEDVDGEE